MNLEETDLTPDSIASGIYESPYFFLLESSLAGPHGRYTIAAWDPVEVYEYNFEEGKEDPFAFLEGKLRNTPRPPLTLRGGEEGLPFHGGWIGYLSYELYGLLEKKVPARRSDLIPAAVFAHYDHFYVYDHLTKKGWLVGATHRGCPLFAVHEPGGHGGLPLQGSKKIQSNFTREQYLATVEKIKAYIAAGDVYQVNFSQQFTAQTRHSPYTLYQHLRQASPAPYSAFLNLGNAQILSASPECFLNVDRGMATTHPIKGTRPRGKTPEEDARLKEELVVSAKDRAELMMIVDLERNDLGRVCEPGSVRTRAPIVSMESFPQVHHLVATIEGKLQPDKTVVDLLRATFPGGSITGAPKIRAMEIIRELEPHARGIYTGAIGFIDKGGNASFNIAIRTMVLKDGVATFCSGGGIVADSDPEKEYEETLAKAAGICRSLSEAESEN